METTQELNFLSVLLPLIAIVFIIAIGVFLLNQHFQRNLFKQKLQQEELKNNQQKELLKSSIEVQETERKRIARDLHDQLGATLSIARMQLVTLEGKPNIEKETIASIQNIKMLTENALTSVRQISHELMPPQLARFGLVKTLESMADYLNNDDELKIQLDADESIADLPSEFALGLYRITMELIQNTLKHAKACSVKISLKSENNRVQLRYVDDGQGIQNDRRGDGLGLRSMEARANAMGGTLEVIKGKGFEARVSVTISI